MQQGHQKEFALPMYCCILMDFNADKEHQHENAAAWALEHEADSFAYCSHASLVWPHDI